MFTQPVSMPCTFEQYENDLKNKLKKLGYSVNAKIYATEKYIETYECRAFGRITKPIKSSFHIEEYNPELFLAIAAMTDKEWGIVGEWWCADESAVDITKGKIYECAHMSLNTIVIIDDVGDEQEIDKEYTRKATLQEILEHFNYNKKEMEQDNTDILQLTPDELRQLLKAIKSADEKIFKANMLDRFLSEGCFFIHRAEFEHYFLKLLKALK